MSSSHQNQQFRKPIFSTALRSTTPPRSIKKDFFADFIRDVALNIEMSSTYYMYHMGTSRVSFMKQLRAYDDNANDNKVIICVGRAGSGKTSFLATISKLKKYEYRIVVKNIDSTAPEELPPIDNYCQGIASTLNAQVMSKLDGSIAEKYKLALNKSIVAFARANSLDETGMNKFISEFKFQALDFCNRYPEANGRMHLAFVVGAISQTLHTPVWIAFDNVDLLTTKQQSDAIDAAKNIFQVVTERCQQHALPCSLRVLVTCRNETYVHHKIGSLPEFAPVLVFPDPDLIGIVKRRMKDMLQKVSKQYVDKNVHFKAPLHYTHRPTWLALSEEIRKRYFKIIENVENGSMEGPGWHARVANYNVRWFLKHWSNLMLCPSFIDRCLFKDDRDIGKLSIHDYFRFLFRAGCEVYPGNESFCTSFDSAHRPLVINIYDNPALETDNFKKVAQNYLALVRIMQFLNLQSTSTTLDALVGHMEAFFDRETIIRSLKLLVWSRLIDEVKSGARNIGDQSSWACIILHDTSEFSKNSTTNSYLTEIIPNYEYTSAMAVASPLLKFNVDRVINEAPSLTESVDYIEALLNTIKQVILENLTYYYNKNVLDDFRRKLYLLGQRHQRPWLGATRGALSAMFKIKGAIFNRNAKLKRTIPPRVQVEYSTKVYQFRDFYISGKMEIQKSIDRVEVQP